MSWNDLGWHAIGSKAVGMARDATTQSEGGDRVRKSGGSASTAQTLELGFTEKPRLVTCHSVRKGGDSRVTGHPNY